MTHKIKIKPNWITGFVDGDGCFLIRKTLSGLRFSFVVSQDKQSVDSLLELNKFFQCGNIRPAGRNMLEYSVGKFEHIANIIIPFFEKYPLLSFKQKDFMSFCHIFKEYRSYRQKNPRTPNYNKTLAASMGKHFENLLGKYRQARKKEPVDNNICEAHYPPVGSVTITNDWFAGFADAEGCFYVSIVKDYPRPQFILGLHPRDYPLIQSLKQFLGCSTTWIRKDGAHIFQVNRINDLILKLIPIIEAGGGLRTTKQLDFNKFKEIVKLISQKLHLTDHGLERIKRLKQAMNRGRVMKVNSV